MNINRDKANLLGVEISDIRSALYSAFGERQVSTIYAPSNSYQVIMQVADDSRVDEGNLGKLFVRSKNNSMVPLSTVDPLNVKQDQYQSIMLDNLRHKQSPLTLHPVPH